MNRYLRNQRAASRHGAIIVLSALLMVLVLGMAAFAIDVGYMLLIRTQLQAAADSGAMAAGNAMHLSEAEIIDLGKEYVAYHRAGGRAIKLDEAIVELGTYNTDSGKFTASSEVGNAVRVTAKRENESFFFGRVLGQDTFNIDASAVAMANPRDIAFVVDLSGSMNDDTEPAWATDAITAEFGPSGYGAVGTQLMQDLYTDLGFGAFPGALEYVAAPLGVASDQYAYAEMTKNGGPLGGSTPTTYKITGGDDELTRKRKAYSWMIDYQLARLMPAARPAPSSSSSYDYWEKYLDYVIDATWVHSPLPPSDSGGGGGTSPPSDPAPKPPIGNYSPRGAALALLAQQRFGNFATPAAMWLMMASPGQPPIDRGWLPPSQDGDRITRFNNPNQLTFPSASWSDAANKRNYLGYLTYVQFLMDHGRDLQPDGSTYVQTSIYSKHCPYHSEGTPGGTFSFPPREQPMHACRRALIAAMAVVEDRNGSIPQQGLRDHVSVVTFDTLDNGSTPNVLQALTGNYKPAMQACTELQAVGDKGSTTATEAGMSVASQHLMPKSKGGEGREKADKVVVLLTDGVPNAYQSTNGDIDTYMTDNPTGEYYGGGYYWLDAALMQSHMMEAGGTDMYPVGIGLGTDYGFMDRMARLGGTSGDSGTSSRGSGNPAEYEAALTEIFEKIIRSPTARLVQ